MKIKIEKLIFEGFGLGHSKEVSTLFVRKSVPEDELEVSIIKAKKNYAEAKIEKVIEPSKYRIDAECTYFEKCGGCEHQNISYENQLQFKEAIFRETLTRQGVAIAPEKIVAGSDSPFFYRNSIRFFFVHKKDGSIAFARHNYLYEEGLIEVDQCFLQSETTNKIMSLLKNHLNGCGQDKTGLWQLKVREGKQTDEFMVEIITSTESLAGEDGIVQTLKTIPEIKSIYHTVAPAKSLKRLRRRLIFGSPIIFEKIGKYKFQISPESFFQTNSLGVHTLYDKIKEFANIKMGDTVLDLYCGTGSIGIYLSTMAKKVIGVEVVPEAIRDAKDNAKINHIQNCEFICSDVTKNEKWKMKNGKYDIVVLDPPRAGLSKDIIFDICNLDFGIIIYVSCNPATFARDIKIFEENGLKLKKVQPIDMFPQTHHIECVGLLKKEGAS